MTDILKTCAHLPVATFAPGEVLLTEGDAAGPLYILIEGKVEVSKNGARIARISGEGTLFGEMSGLLGLPISATVTAVEAVRAYRSDDPDAFIAESPEMARHTARLLAARLHAATTYIADLKVQFAGETGHLGMMDKMLDAMLEGQVGTLGLQDAPPRKGSDARL